MKENETGKASEVRWTDGIGPRERKKALLVIGPDARPYWFRGGSDGNVTVVHRKWTKDGKWSRTDYVLMVQGGVRVLPLSQGFESGKWREGFALALSLPEEANWQAIAQALGVAVDSLVGPKPEKGPGTFVVIPDGPARQDGGDAE